MYRTSPIFTADQFLHLKQVLGNLFYLLGKTSPTANSNSEKLCKLSEQALVDYEQGCGVRTSNSIECAATPKLLLVGRNISFYTDSGEDPAKHFVPNCPQPQHRSTRHTVTTIP